MLKFTLPALLALGFAASAQAQIITIRLPGAAGLIAPMKLPGVSIGAIIPVPSLLPSALPLTPISLPSRPVPVISPVNFPGVPSPLPLQFPAALAARRFSAPNVDHLAINWSALNKGDDGVEPALVPVDPGPQPLSPAGALNELRDAAAGRDAIRVAHHAEQVFDGRRETTREVALPHGRFF